MPFAEVQMITRQDRTGVSYDLHLGRSTLQMNFGGVRTAIQYTYTYVCVYPVTSCIQLCDNPSFLQDWWPLSRVCLSKHLRPGFDSLILLVSWQLWKERNSRVFDSVLSLVSEVLQSILSEGHLWSLVGIANFGVFGEQWTMSPSHCLESQYRVFFPLVFCFPPLLV